MDARGGHDIRGARGAVVCAMIDACGFHFASDTSKTIQNSTLNESYLEYSPSLLIRLPHHE